MTDVLRPAAAPGGSGVEYVFEAYSTTLPSIREYVESVWERRRFIIEMAKSDIRGPRAHTVLGELWSVVDPLFQAAIYFFLVMVIRGGAGGDATDYLIRVVSGIFLFGLSSAALGRGGRSIIQSRGLLLNSTFPRALLPITAIYRALLELMPCIAVYALLHVAAFRGPIGMGLFVLPLIFLIHVVSSLGIAFLFATLTVYIRDMGNLLDYIGRILMFSTPILWDVDRLPAVLTTVLQVVNPIFGIFASYQAILLGGMPNPLHILVGIVWSVVLLVVGVRLFMRNERSFALFL